jgi:hypothetical protein
MGQAGARRAQLFKAGAVVPQVEAVYRRLAEGTSASSVTDASRRDVPTFSA